MDHTLEIMAYPSLLFNAVLHVLSCKRRPAVVKYFIIAGVWPRRSVPMKEFVFLCIIFDNAATTRVCPEAAEAAVYAMCEEFGNPSSLHRMGLEASHLLEDSRRTVCVCALASPEEVYFTACGTETNISLRGAAHLNRHKKGAASSRPRSSARQPSTPQSSLLRTASDVVFLGTGRNAGHITPRC